MLVKQRLDGSTIADLGRWNMNRIYCRCFVGHQCQPEWQLQNRTSSSTRSSAGSNFYLLPVQTTVPTESCRNVNPSPDLCLKTVLEICRQALGRHGLVCALTCTNCRTVYKQMCTFPNRVQSTDWFHRWTPSVETGCTWAHGDMAKMRGSHKPGWGRMKHLDLMMILHWKQTRWSFSHEKSKVDIFSDCLWLTVLSFWWRAPT